MIQYDFIDEEYVIDYNKEFTIEPEPEWYYRLFECPSKLVCDKFKMKMIWKLNDLETALGDLPLTLSKLRDKYIYTPISKSEFIVDVEYLIEFENTINEKIIESLNDFTHQ